MNRRTVFRTAGYLALFVFFTLLFLLVNYPSERLTGLVNNWVDSKSGGALIVEDVQVKPPISLQAGKVLIKTGTLGSVDVGSVVIKPRFLGFLVGKKGADLHLESPWLEMWLTFISSGESLELDVPSAAIDLSNLPEEIINLPILLEGNVGMSLNVASADLSRGISNGDVNMGSDAILIGGDLLETLGIGALRISRFLVTATVQDNVLELGENAVEGDITAVARGSVRLSPGNYSASRLDLTLELTPGAQKRERLVPLLGMLGGRARADGSILVRIRGTLGRPSVTM